MASEKELSDFLKSIEKRAYKRAVYAVRDEDAALDIVQDTMIRLAEKYFDRPAAELPLLFQRILSNATMDWFRRQRVRNAVIQNLSDSGGAARYRVTVEVTDSQGAIVPLRAADSGEPPRDVFELERTADSQPVDLRLELRLARAQPGPHSVRVQVTDLGSGQTVNGVAGFEIR